MNLNSVQCPHCGEWVSEGKLPGHLVLVHTAALDSWPETDEYRNLVAAMVNGMPEGDTTVEITCHGCGEIYKVEASHDRARIMQYKWLQNHVCISTTSY